MLIVIFLYYIQIVIKRITVITQLSIRRRNIVSVIQTKIEKLKAENEWSGQS